MTDIANQFNVLVHAAVDRVTSPRRETDARIEVRTEDLLAACGQLAAVDLQIQRWRWRGHEAARQVATYLAFCQPPVRWRRAQLPHQVAGRGLLWQRDGAVFADLLATGRTSGRELWAGDVISRPGALVERGRESLGERFAGVRVLALLEPASSVFVDDAAAPPRPLADTPWAFGAAGTVPRSELAAAAAGEVVR